MTDSSKPSLFLIGTGLIGGNLLFQLIRSERYDITVGARSLTSIKVLQNLGIKTLQISLDDHAALTRVVQDHDIIINAANCDNVGAAKAFIAGLEAGPRKKTFMQISGAGVYGSRFNPEKPLDFVWDDADPSIINTLTDNSPHRPVDLEFWRESQKGTSNIIIAIPATVYGKGGSPFKNISTQVPMKTRDAIKNGYVSYGSKEHMFAKIHVEDNSRAMVLILGSVIDGTVDVSHNPYFNVNDDQPSTWKVVAHHIAASMHKQGALPSAAVEVEGEWDFYGIYNPGASRLRNLGWRSRFAADTYLVQGIDHEVKVVLGKEQQSETVLVTGGSGYLGSSVATALLRHSRAFNVRLALRSKEQFDEWTKEYPQYRERLEYVGVTTLTDPQAYTEAVKGVAYIVHTASPNSSAKDDTARDLLDPAIKGITNLLEAAAGEKSIKSIVFTSSIASHVDFANVRESAEKPYDGGDWNLTTYQQAQEYGKSPQTALLAYAASKALADKSAFDFVTERKPKWQLTAISPCWVTGPTEQPHLAHVKDLRTTSQTAYRSLLNEAVVVPNGIPFYVDVRDAAWAHVEALVSTKTNGKRYILSGGRVDYVKAVAVIQSAVPPLKSRLARVEQSSYNPTEPPYFVSSKEAEQDLGVSFTTFEDSIADWASQVATLRY